jgi:hypothetical protein
MSWSSELLFAASVAVAAFLAGLLWLRHRGPRTRNVVHGKKNRTAPAPVKLRYTCASCAGQFTHSRRTLSAREKGSTSFYCSACYTRSLGEGAPSPTRFVPNAKRSKRR